MSQFVNRYMHPFRVEEKTITGLLGEYFCITKNTYSSNTSQRERDSSDSCLESQEQYDQWEQVDTKHQMRSVRLEAIELHQWNLGM